MKTPIFFILSLLLFACLSSNTFCQPAVSNIRIETDAKRVKVTYDLAGMSNSDSIYFQIESRSRGILNIKTVTGDIGRGITPGPDKVVIWEYALDGEQLKDEIRPIIGIAKFKEPSLADTLSIGGGPANALFSVLVPGLGNILVQPNHKLGLRPLITGTYGGLMVYGLIQKAKSNKQYSLYQNVRYERDAQPYYNRANQSHHRYLLAVSVAASVLAADVVYTFLKGLKNDRKKRNAEQEITFSYLGKAPMVGFRLIF